MKKVILPIVFGLISIVFTHAQSCLPEGIVFESQVQIDNFQYDFPDCTEIEGGVVIEGNDITNLDGLNVITAIGGYL
jgi:hypothetical protein